jgi:hypothetical protein
LIGHHKQPNKKINKQTKGKLIQWHILLKWSK